MLEIDGCLARGFWADNNYPTINFNQRTKSYELRILRCIQDASFINIQAESIDKYLSELTIQCTSGLPRYARYSPSHRLCDYHGLDG